jgi:hypothetical protein
MYASDDRMGDACSRPRAAASSAPQASPAIVREFETNKERTRNTEARLALATRAEVAGRRVQRLELELQETAGLAACALQGLADA